MKTKVLKVYVCEYCNTESGGRASAMIHEKGCLTKKEKRDKEAAKTAKAVEKFLAAKSIDEIVQQMEEFLGTKVKLDILYSNVSNSHECPKGGVTNWSSQHKNLPTSYKGWHGQISGNFCVYQLRDLGIFHSGTGCPGSVSEYGCDISFCFFEDDFPVLKGETQKYLALKVADRLYKDECEQIGNDALNFLTNATYTDETVCKLSEELKVLEDKLEGARYNARVKATPAYEKMATVNPRPYSVEELQELRKNLRI